MLNILNIEVSTHVKHTKHRYLHSTLMLKCCTFRYLHMLNILNIEVSTHVKHAKHWYLHSTWMLNIFLNNNYFTMRGGVMQNQQRGGVIWVLKSVIKLVDDMGGGGGYPNLMTGGWHGGGGFQYPQKDDIIFAQPLIKLLKYYFNVVLVVFNYIWNIVISMLKYYCNVVLV